MEMTQCKDFTWCCGSQNFTNCCDKGLGFALPDNLVTFNTPNTTQTTTVSPAAATVTHTPTSSAAKDKSGTVDSKVLIGVAVPLAILIFAGAAGGFWAGLRRGQGLAAGTGKHDDTQDYMMGNGNGVWNNKPGPVYGGEAVHEISAQTPIAELGNDRRK